MDQIKIGKFIAYKRKEKNLTQSDLANMLNVSNRTISKWETGRGMPDLSLFDSLCQSLDITYNELLNGEIINNKNNQYEDTIKMTIDYSNTHIEKNNKKIKFLSIILFGVLIAFLSFLWDNPNYSYGGVSLAFWLMAASCIIPILSFVYKDYTNLISIISFSLCLISILNIFHLTNKFVFLEDSIAIYDTFPFMFSLSKFCIIVSISANLGVYLMNKKKST